jgi:oligosaccharide repeat unit polymerase
MTILIIIYLGGLTLLFGRWMFGYWFTPFNLYTAIWTISLSLFELRLIVYYPLEAETWIMIVDAWLSFSLGCLIFGAYRYVSVKNIQPTGNGLSQPGPTENEIGILKTTIIVFSIIAALVVLQYWYVVVKKAGSVMNVFLLANTLYSYRVSEGLPGTIPYLDSLALTGSLLSGVYLAFRRRFHIITLFCPIIIIFDEIASMGRAKILTAAILFFAGYFLGRTRCVNAEIIEKTGSLRRIIPIVFAALVLVSGAEFIRSTRGAVESLPAATTSLNKIRNNAFITPSIYMYLTSHHGVFNQYLKHDEEHTPWGSNTFAPLYRFLSKFGFDTYVPNYMPFYTTPVGSNTGTYLREIHADFGLSGIFIFPFLLGCLSTLYWYRFIDRGRYIDLAILAHLLLVVTMSFFINVMRAGHWVASLIFTLLICYYIETRKKSEMCITSGATENAAPGGILIKRDLSPDLRRGSSE